jgi:hypothetical protein
MSETVSNLTIESLAVHARNLENERDAWKKEAEIQHDVCVTAFEKVRKLTAALERQLEINARLRKSAQITSIRAAA